jgi:DNA-binding transcriptional regulator YiaG
VKRLNIILKDKTKQFLSASRLNKTDFAKYVGMSVTTLNSWLRNEREISTNLENQISYFMTNYVKQLIEISK